MLTEVSDATGEAASATIPILFHLKAVVSRKGGCIETRLEASRRTTKKVKSGRSRRPEEELVRVFGRKDFNEVPVLRRAA